MLARLIWLWREIGGEGLSGGLRVFGFERGRGISWPLKRQLALQEGQFYENLVTIHCQTSAASFLLTPSAYCDKDTLLRNTTE
jgi:hypothetical protein